MGQLLLSRSGPSRDPSAGPPWLASGYRLSGDRLDEALSTAGRAAELLGWPAAPTASQMSSHAEARELLGRAWRDAAGSVAAAAGDESRLAELVELLCALKEVDDRVRDDAFARQNSMVELVHEALAALRDVRSTDELLDRLAVATGAMGFDRGVVSRVESSTWLPESAFVARDPDWAEEILAAGRAEPRILDKSLLETEIVRRQRPIVVNDVVNRSNLHRALVDSSMTRSYAAAPVLGWGRVVGFVHVDCFHQRRNLERLDRDLLWMFCEGVGALLTRARLLDGLARLRDGVDRLAGGAPDPVQTHPAESPDPVSRLGVELFGEVRGSSLTPREVDVLRLMAGGYTNARIARRLVISEGTVKSHVKHILRKMNAANRAEAVSRWMGGRSVSRPPSRRLSVS